MATFRFVPNRRIRRGGGGSMATVLLLLVCLSNAVVAFPTTTRPRATVSLAQSSRSYEQYYNPARRFLPLFAPSSSQSSSVDTTTTARKRNQQKSKATTATTPNLLQQYAWLLPLSLCTIPVLTQVWFRTWPATPHWWKLVDFQSIYQHSTNHGATALVFLASNASYLGSFWLLQRRRAYTVAAWTLAAGTMSCLFHTAQVYAPYSIAEALCYWDHGIAMTATLLLYKTFGRPLSLRGWGLGGLSLVTLCLPAGPLYAVWHAAWHVLSAATAVVWVRDNQRLLRVRRRRHLRAVAATRGVKRV